jgi:hypothetical protein
MRKVREQVGFGNGGGTAADAAGCFQDAAAQIDEDALLNLDAAVVRGEYLALVFF